MKTHLLIPIVSFLAAATVLAAEADKDYVAHEWGTFTSVQGADGVQMIWNPQVSSELPAFVYEFQRVALKNPAAGLAKDLLFGRQRMETPVIYFYSARPRTVDVAVKFPSGKITEWYPQESAADLSVARFSPHPSNIWPELHWKDVQILPMAGGALKLPTESHGSHYYAARETDSAFLRVPAGAQKSETEKFLFYRGVADFEAPLTVRLVGDNAANVSLENKGPGNLRSLFLYEVQPDGGISWSPLSDLKPGETRVTALAGHTSNADSLAAALRVALVREGLYEKEAAAMVKTWESSWLKERGLRVLYTLPRAWTDGTLPLTVTPAPAATERVMVGRAEIITPAMEQALQAQVERYERAPEEQRPAVIADTRALGFGRFLGSVWARIEARRHQGTGGPDLLSVVMASEKKPAGTN